MGVYSSVGWNACFHNILSSIPSASTKGEKKKWFKKKQVLVQNLRIVSS